MTFTQKMTANLRCGKPTHFSSTPENQDVIQLWYTAIARAIYAQLKKTGTTNEDCIRGTPKTPDQVIQASQLIADSGNLEIYCLIFQMFTGNHPTTVLNDDEMMNLLFILCNPNNSNN